MSLGSGARFALMAANTFSAVAGRDEGRRHGPMK